MEILGALLVSAAVAAAGLAARMDGAELESPELMTVPAGPYTFRTSGNWTRDGRKVVPPLMMRQTARALDVTKYQISRASTGSASRPALAARRTTARTRCRAERLVDDAGAEDDPGQRLLAGHARNVAGRENRDAEVRPRGAGGENSMGLSDLATNVWERTDTCVFNGVVDEAGVAHPIDTYCGARVAAGQHRAMGHRFRP